MKNESIAQIKQLLQVIDSDQDERILQWKKDERQGVQQALTQWNNKQRKQKQQQLLYEKMCQFEQNAYEKGYQWIAGIDEVGRGPLAGPVVAAAVILPKNNYLIGVNDSKQLSERKREELFQQIQKQALAIGIGVADHLVIDTVNIYQATKQAMKQAIQLLPISPDYLLIDAMTVESQLPQENIIKGDTRSISIAAASIIAKVTRDRLMKKNDQLYPGYGFAKNAGYGTKEHLAGLAKLGICPIHRKTFAPIKKLV